MKFELLSICFILFCLFLLGLPSVVGAEQYITLQQGNNLPARNNFINVIISPFTGILLLSIGFISLIFELLAPGWGLGGTLAIICFGLYFGGFLLNDVNNWVMLLFFMIGILLIICEIFVIPGFGVTGVAGFVIMLVSVYFLYPGSETAIRVIASSLVISLLGGLVIIRLFGISRLWENISLRESQSRETGYVANLHQQNLLGEKGETVTPLRPAGIAFIVGKRLDVVSEGDYIDKNTPVEIIKITGRRIVVQKIKKEEM